MQIYTPNTILIPKEVLQHPSVCPAFLKTYDQVQKNLSTGELYQLCETYPKMEKRLTEEERKHYLFHIKIPYLYDVFLRIRGKGDYQLVVIATNHEVIYDLTSYPEIWHNNRLVRYKIFRMDEFQIFVADCNGIVKSEKEPLSFDFKWLNSTFSFSRTIKVSFNQWETSPPKLTLSTLQKDNPTEWIRDWVLYHHRIHGVERVLLYDNNSKNKDKLIACLNSLENDNLQIYLIHWDVDYVPHHLGKCQIAQINHAYYWLWNKISWIINFDIDEYLVNHTKMSLSNYLQRYTGTFCSSLNLNLREISNLDQNGVNLYYSEENKQLPLVTDFKWIKKEQKIAYKNIILSSKGSHINIKIHHSFFELPLSPIKKYLNKKPSKLANILMYVFCSPVFSLCYLKISRWIYKILQLATRILNRINIKYPYPIMQHILVKRPIEWGIYFHHYRGLNTFWKESQIWGDANIKACEEDKFMFKELSRAKVGKYYKDNKGEFNP